MDVDRIQAIKNEYEGQALLCSAFRKKISLLIRELIENSTIKASDITSRVKAFDSLESKLLQEADASKYQKLSDVTDLIGVRVISYFADDVDRIAEIITREFEVDPRNSIDKRASLEPDQFGYLSLHFICTLSEARTNLTEFRQFKGYKFELQIRSVLQHAWAEIEHDLGYKSKEAIPREIRRQFSRVAGLLEVADSEFCDLRNYLLRYENEVPRQIAEDPSRVLINQASLEAYIQKSDFPLSLDKELAKAAGLELTSDYHPADTTLSELALFGIESISQLDRALKQKRPVMVRFVKKFFELRPRTVGKSSFPRGICLFYLGYILAAESGTRSRIHSLLNVRVCSDDNQLVKHVLEAHSDATAIK